MSPPNDLPELTIVHVLTSAGPFAQGDAVSIAFVSPTVARLLPHAARAISPGGGDTALLPETLSARVVVDAGPYAEGDVLTLSFVDPRFARLHALARPDPEPRAPATAPSPFTPEPHPTPARVLTTAGGVRTRLGWSADRARRFVQVCDKLFTIDRLGWYRHAFAMRLLVPDHITCGESTVDATAARHLQTLRTATTETLGRPLVAAFMPNFAVTPEWLDSLDDAAIALPLSSLRETIAPHATQTPFAFETVGDTWTQGAISRSDLEDAPAGSVESLLPLLVANVSKFDAVTEELTAYRKALVELFSQTARSVEAVRLKQMAQPNHVLDDRLWRLVGAIGECFGGLAVA
jgi:hypothetical protein